MVGSGIGAFDVASPDEMAKVRVVAPKAVLHYNNPVRSPAEITAALGFGVRSWSVDSRSELAKLTAQLLRKQCEICVRFKLPVTGAAYDFGAKFGATPQLAAALLREVAALGFIPSLTFHPGTQCHEPKVWQSYIEAAGMIAASAGVALRRLNVGGGFPSHRLQGVAPRLGPIFAMISDTLQKTFAPGALPQLVCEPGRAMVGDACALATRVKALREDGSVFLNDGVYGGLCEHLVMGPIDRVAVISPDGARKVGAHIPRPIFGPTCDSVDKLPEPLALPVDISEGDYVIFQGLGAYSQALATRFNGYGVAHTETVARLTD